MKRFPKRALVAATAIGLVVSLAGCSTGGNGEGDSGESPQNTTLVAEQTFDLKTLDPARSFELSSGTIIQAVYEGALQFDNGDLTKVIPWLCTYTISADNKVVTLKMNDKYKAKFSNGDPVTIDDVVYSYQRLQGIKGNPSFKLDGVTVAKTGADTATLTSEIGKAELPFILPGIMILNSKVVAANGGTLDQSDAAQDFLNKNTQGSGPYKVDSYNPDSEVVMVVNEHYAGTAPKFKRIVLKNVSGDTQLTDIQSGQANVAFSLNQDQISGLDMSTVQVSRVMSQRTVYIYHNSNPAVNEYTANKDFRDAVRYAVDYDKVMALAGEGAAPIASLVPNQFLGAVPQSKAAKRDLTKAKAALAKSGYKGEAIPFNYDSTQNVGGLSVAKLAEMLSAQLKEAGINIELKPAAGAAQLDGYRSGNHSMGIGAWGADFPDPADYLVFTPGQSLAKRVQWGADANAEVSALTKAAIDATGDARGPAYTKLYEKLTEVGPFVPLVQPAQSVVVSKNVKKFVSTPDRIFEFSKAE